MNGKARSSEKQRKDHLSRKFFVFPSTSTCAENLELKLLFWSNYFEFSFAPPPTRHTRSVHRRHISRFQRWENFLALPLAAGKTFTSTQYVERYLSPEGKKAKQCNYLPNFHLISSSQMMLVQRSSH